MNLDDLETMDESQLEAEAMKQGFNPNYDGENKKTPKEFLEVAINHNHVLKERNEKLSTDYDEMKSEFESLKGQLSKQQENTQKLIKFQEEQKKKAVEKAVKALKAERKEAITEGDHERVEQIDQEIDEQKAETTSDNGVDPDFEDWRKANAWYDSDPIIRAEANEYARIYATSGEFKTPEDVRNAVTVKMKRVNPELFENPKKKEPAEVEGGRPSPTKKSKKSYEDLPADAKKACDEFVAEGLMKREEYVSMYEWE